jgi:hypothetical protein
VWVLDLDWCLAKPSVKILRKFRFCFGLVGVSAGGSGILRRLRSRRKLGFVGVVAVFVSVLCAGNFRGGN